LAWEQAQIVVDPHLIVEFLQLTFSMASPIFPTFAAIGDPRTLVQPLVQLGQAMMKGGQLKCDRPTATDHKELKYETNLNDTQFGGTVGLLSWPS